MCNCKIDINKKLTDMFADKAATSTDHKVELKCYGIAMTEKGCIELGYMPYETYCLEPLKKGGSRPMKTTGNMFFSYCPFCGEKVSEE